LQRSVGQTERRIPAAAVAVEERQGKEDSEEQSRTAAVGVQYCMYIQEVPVPSHGRWCRRLSERSPQEQGTAWKGEGIKVEAHARCMAAATNDRSAGWLQRAWHTSQHLVFPAQFASSLGRARGGQRLARVAAGRPPLKTHVACGAGMSLGGNSNRKGGQTGHVVWE